MLVTYDFTNGDAKPMLGLLTGVTSGSGSQCFSSSSLPCWGDQQTLNSTNSEGAINTATITDPLNGASLAGSEFGEAGIDLSQTVPAFKGTPTSCETFGSAYLKSRSSASFTAELKDFVAPQPISVSICGTITIRKVTENGDGSFSFTTSGSPAPTPSPFTLSNNGKQSLTNPAARSPTACTQAAPVPRTRSTPEP